MSHASASTSQTAPIAEHQPYVPASIIMPEFTWSALLVGCVLGIIFGASSMYLVLKVGMTVSASIPIAVLSITLFRVFAPILGRRATILENNIVQTTGSAGESIAFGVGVTMPALMILGYDMEITRVMLVSVLGGLLGVLMMIPLRRPFIVKQHGKLAYPEGTACADVLIVGEKGGTSAKTVFVGFGLAFVYQFLTASLKLWKDIPEKGLGFFKGAAISGELAPHLLGVGYIIGTRISCVMVAGGVLASWVLIPAIVLFGSALETPIYPGTKLIRDMSLDEIWHDYILYIGAGAVATGGIVSMIRSMPLIASSIRSGLRDLGERRAVSSMNQAAGAEAVPRTDRDLSMKVVLFGSLGIVIAITLAPMLHMNALGAVLIVLFGFLFVTVSSRLTGEIGSSSNPISGMTVATLLMTCLVFLALGWVGEGYRLTALSIAAIVCIAASNGGTTSQDLKTGYLVGGTPRFQQLAILIGALTSALVIGFVLLLLNDAQTVYTQKNLPNTYIDPSTLTQKDTLHGRDAAHDSNTYLVLHATEGEYPAVPAAKYLVDQDGHIVYMVDPGINGALTERDDGSPVEKFSAPKARLMSLIIDGILTQKLPWSLVLLGVAISLVLELASVPSLPFAVGVYLPLSASTPIFIGGVIRWIVDKWKGRSAAQGDMSPGVLLSSGYIAGGTIAGIVAAIIALSVDWSCGESLLGAAATSNWLTLIPFGLLTVFLLLVGGNVLLKSGRK